MLIVKILFYQKFQISHSFTRKIELDNIYFYFVIVLVIVIVATILSFSTSLLWFLRTRQATKACSMSKIKARNLWLRTDCCCGAAADLLRIFIFSYYSRHSLIDILKILMFHHFFHCYFHDIFRFNYTILIIFFVLINMIYIFNIIYLLFRIFFNAEIHKNLVYCQMEYFRIFEYEFVFLNIKKSHHLFFGTNQSFE